MSLLPSRGPDTSTSQEGELQVVGVDDEVAPLLDALNSETARAILNEIYDEPGTPSEIADRLDMSIQKVSYHIEKLDDQDLIAVAGTQYSEKGQEMTVYQPPDDPTVLFVGTEERKRSLTTMVKRLLPVVGVVALGSLVIEQLFGNGLSVGFSSAGPSSQGGDGAGGSDSGGVANTTGATETPTEAPADTPTPTETASDGGDISMAEATETPADSATSTPTPPPETDTPVPEEETVDLAAETTTQAADLAANGGLELSPGLAFFLGGMTVVAVLGVWWAYTRNA
ncbi:winged helix-turn-helix domain-containing protein [Halomicrobium sp. LC1Hm]|uniref:ArsR/SmtB family transcription factor n=1 Tax=Halomicrobium sp. LC1Hm TaxID=2610902 RepID=UPI0012982629|nr:winged helix-turn-helix domain-containing protein [Halomicrobium sp. LC1Hm]QGA82748.1 Transcriptional regulator containing HTH domain, ArsR family [Halomicrobium sp. LC1Hm]